MEWPALAAVLAICLFCGFVQSLTGFGFGICAMSLLPLCLDIKVATPLVVLLCLVVALGTLRAYWRHYEWRQSWELVLGVVCGAPLGVIFLVRMDARFILHLLGIMLLLVCLQEVLAWRVARVRLSRLFALPCGIVSGALGGAFNLGGPPALFYVYGRAMTPEKTIATLQAVFFCSNVARLIPSIGLGLVSVSVVKLAAIALMPSVAGIYLGYMIRRRLHVTYWRLIIFTGLAVLGVKYLLS